MKQFLVSTSLPLKVLIAISTCVILVATIFVFTLFKDSLTNVGAAEQQLKETVVSGLNQPIPFDWLPDNSMVIGEKGGRLLRFANGQTQTIATLTVSSFSERGLLGIAIDPNFTANRQIYLNLSATTGVNRVVRYTLTENFTLADEFILLDNIYSSTQGNHNAGDLHFDSNRNLYISTGDGGAANSCKGCSQKLDSPNGKILRINPDTGAGVADNPFISNTNEVAKKVWAYGLRNPYRFGIRPNTNLLYIADVGENRFEELDLGIPGANYGWPQVEGPLPSSQPGITYPVFYYERSNNSDPSFNNCSSVTGGAFTKGNNFPANYTNHYFFGDYTCGKIWSADSNNPQSASLFAQNVGAPVHIAFGNDGALYYSDISSGSIKRIKYIYTNTPTPAPTQSNQPTSSPSPTPTASPSPSPTSSPSPSASNTPPTLTITSPANNTKALPDDSILAEATVSDAEDQTISGNNIQWNVVRHHGTSHTHPWYQGTGSSISFPMPAPEDLETAANSHLEAIATIQDSQGATSTQSVNIYFETVDITFQTQPAGLKLVLNNLQYTAPTTIPAVKDQSFSVSAPAQEFNGKTYTFVSWSDNQPAEHNYIAPQTSTTLTATFSETDIATSPTPSATVTPTSSPIPVVTPTPSATPAVTPSVTPTTQPTNSPIPTSSPTSSENTLLILCSYDDKNANGIPNWGEEPVSWTYNYEYNGEFKYVESNWWQFWTQGCAKVEVPTDTQITVSPEQRLGWIHTGIYADGAKTDLGPYTYTSDIDAVKILWYLENQLPESTPTPSASPSPTPSPTLEPSASPTPSPTIEPTISPTSSPTPSPTASPSPSPTPSQTVFDISEAEIAPPFKIADGMMFQTNRTVDSLDGSGRARLPFTIDTAGTYRIRALVLAVDHNSNSMFYNIDQEPTVENIIWDFQPSSSLQEVVSSMRKNNQRYIENINEKRFDLSAGNHELIIRGRETNLKIQKITIEKIN